MLRSIVRHNIKLHRFVFFRFVGVHSTWENKLIVMLLGPRKKNHKLERWTINIIGTGDHQLIRFNVIVVGNADDKRFSQVARFMGLEM